VRVSCLLYGGKKISTNFHKKGERMDITIELSHYPLTNNYKEEVKAFIATLKSNNDDLQIQVDGMSTKIAGDFDKAIELTKKQVHKYLEQKDAVFVMKIAKGQRA
jgi:uncharacterized protein YqgV (UPF0045/DUF77 family)